MLFTPKKVLSLLILIGSTSAVLQTGQLDVTLSNGVIYQLLVSQASFGAYPKQGVENNEAHTLALSPKDNPLLCDNTTNASPTSTGLYLLVPRGECTFETKAMNAQRLGAAGIIVEGSLASRYTLNKTEEKTSYTVDDIIYPANLNDYDCQKGRAEIPANSISMTPLPYNADLNDPVLSGDSPSNLCLQASQNQLADCDSKACLLTGNKTQDGKLEACCAWDFHLWLFNDPTFTTDEIRIPAVYVTLRQAQQLMQDMKSNTVTVIISSRDRAEYNISAILIWALGVFVATVAAYMSASDYRDMTNRYTQQNNNLQPESSSSMMSSASLVNSESEALTPTRPNYTAPAEETLELSAEHALGFIVMASSGLFILFFFKIYSAVKVMYGFGCSRAVMQVIFLPLVRSIFNRVQLTNKVIYRTNIEDIGDITTIDLIAGICGYSLGMSWLFVAFTTFHPESNPFFWVTQDIMGACMCIMFLSIIKLNSMKVASILLMVAFFYDIFFVFVTPLIFKGESVMITVATSGGPPKADPLWCEKYPHDANCQGGDPLPMLLTMPRIHDYQGGASLLGLGDIVLPGLLLSFAARLDAAKTFLGVVGGGSRSVNYAYACPKQRFCVCCNSGYFAPLVVAYAIGLMMANCAVYLMNMGQPALLYLVPMCLGCMWFMGWKRNELTALWEGPKLIRTVDVMLYGEYEGHVAVPQDDDDVDDDDVAMETGASSSAPSARVDGNGLP